MKAKLNPTLFDKLTVSDRITNIVDEGADADRGPGGPGETQLRLNPTFHLDRFNEAALRATVRRELNWLLNTVHLEAGQDFTRYPEVRSSVLNYGMPDLTGRASTAKAVQGRTNEMVEAIRRFEPRLDATKLKVQARPGITDDNAVTYVIEGDITAAVRAMPVQYLASVEVETGEAVVRE